MSPVVQSRIQYNNDEQLCYHDLVYYILLLLGGAGRHTTPASSECAQLCDPIGLAVQLRRVSSFPLHATSSRTIEPVPCPKAAQHLATAPTNVVTINNILI